MMMYARPEGWVLGWEIAMDVQPVMWKPSVVNHEKVLLFPSKTPRRKAIIVNDLHNLEFLESIDTQVDTESTGAVDTV